MAQPLLQSAGAIAPAVPAQQPVTETPCDLKVEGLCKTFGKDRSVLREVSFSVGREEAVALIGSNGAGKSTALRCA